MIAVEIHQILISVITAGIYWWLGKMACGVMVVLTIILVI